MLKFRMDFHQKISLKEQNSKWLKGRRWSQHKYLSKTSYSEDSDKHRQRDGSESLNRHFIKVTVLAMNTRKDAQLHSDQDKNWYNYTSICRSAKIKEITKCGVEKLELLVNFVWEWESLQIFRGYVHLNIGTVYGPATSFLGIQSIEMACWS